MFHRNLARTILETQGKRSVESLVGTSLTPQDSLIMQEHKDVIFEIFFYLRATEKTKSRDPVTMWLCSSVATSPEPSVREP